MLPDHDAAKALAHPLRAAILAALVDREASPVELAREMGEPVGNMSYHVKILRDLGAVAQVRQRHVRRAMEHFYTATVRIAIKQEPL